MEPESLYATRSLTPPPPRHLHLYRPPSSDIWTATLPNWKRRLVVAASLGTALAVVAVRHFIG